MPTIALNGGGSSQLPKGIMTVTLETEGPSGVGVLYVQPEASAVRPRAGIAVLPTLAGKVRFAARPKEGAVFPPATVLHLTITVDQRPEPHRVLVSTRNAGGMDSYDLAVAEPAGDGIRVYREQDDGDDSSLSPIAEAARTETRRLIGPRQLLAGNAQRVHVAVDGSASMVRHSTDGSIAGLIELLEGIATAVSPESALTSLRIAGQPGALSLGPATTGATVESALFDGALGIGSPPLPDASGGPAPAVCFYITDTVPCAARDPFADVDVHLVVVADAGAAGILAEQATSPCTFVTPPSAGRSLGETLLGDTDLLRATVAALAARFHVDQTSQEESNR